MNVQNLGQILTAIDLIPLASVTADGNGTGVDIQQFDGELAVFLACKNTAGATPTLDVTLEDSADNSSFAAIAGAAFTQVTDADTSAAVLLKLTIRADQVRRYIRAVKDIGGTSSPAFMTACFAVGTKQVRS
ncbi:MAG: hypothetical protein WC809_18865 [Sinimarinibacterium sp.]|jgi:hypothetical protein